MSLLLDYAAVGAGGMVGALTRHVVTEKAKAVAATSPPFMKPPYQIALINIVGSFILGGVAGSNSLLRPPSSSGSSLPKPISLSVSAPRSNRAALFIGVGFCGALTTFSTFSVDTLTMIQSQSYARALSYVAVNNVGGLGAATAGFFLFKALRRKL